MAELNAEAFVLFSEIAREFVLENGELELAEKGGVNIDTICKEVLLADLKEKLKVATGTEIRRVNVFHFGNVEKTFELCFWSSIGYIPAWGGMAHAITLFSIVIPPALRCQGIANEILEILEEKALKEKKALLVRPVVSDDLERILVKRKYKGRTIMDCYFVHPRLKVVGKEPLPEEYIS